MPVNPSPAAERRRARRKPATGAVRLSPTDALSSPFEGRLQDTAETGFRARHNRLVIAPGQVLKFEMDGAAGLARAVWTRIVDGQAETGFHILSRLA
jgi:hypothetical protein